MKSKIIMLERQTGDTLTINNTFESLEQCIEHLETIKKCKNIIIKQVKFIENKEVEL